MYKSSLPLFHFLTARLKVSITFSSSFVQAMPDWVTYFTDISPIFVSNFS